MLIFPNVEKTTRAYLLPELNSEFEKPVGVGVELPDNTDWSAANPWLVVLTVTGVGVRRSVVFEEVLIGYHCYAPTRDEAQKLCAHVRSLLEEWPNLSGQVAGYRPNAYPSDATSATRYPAYYGSSSLLFKATEA